MADLDEVRAALDALERIALGTAEGAEPTPAGLRARALANGVRDALDVLEREVKAARGRGQDVVKAARAAGVLPGGLKHREREVMFWRRGTSVAMKFMEVDTAYFEDLASRARGVGGIAALRLRPVYPPTTRPEDVELAIDAGRAVRALLAEQGDDAISGDVVVRGPVARNVGGSSGRDRVVTFGFRVFETITEVVVP